jgi:DNA invertase Pin-like site-specific DNA recombinase
MSKAYGCARVSTQEQNLDRQLDALERYGIDAACIYTD